MHKKSYYVDIQGLRGVAVLAVLLFHSMPDSFPNGFLGVDIFFVISGFVVTPLIFRLIDTNSISYSLKFRQLKIFYKNRFLRLAPAFLATIIIFGFLILLFGIPKDHSTFAKQGISSILLIGNFGAYQLSGDYFAPLINPLLHFWSLSVEAQIYILVPLLIIVVYKKFLKVSEILFLVLALSSLISFYFPNILKFLYKMVGIENAELFSFYSTFDRLHFFLLGGILFQTKIRDRKKQNNYSFKILSVLIVVFLLLILFTTFSFKDRYGSFLITLATMIIIATGCLEKPFASIKIFNWIGDRSYSIYLVHMPLHYLFESNKFIGASYLTIFFSIVIGHLFFSKIENRYRINNGKHTQNQKYSNVKSLITLIIISISLQIQMLFGNMTKYYGLDKNIYSYIYGGNLDPSCDRDSESESLPCIYAQPHYTKTVLLLGDSHAADLSESVINAAKSLEWNAVIWTHAGQVLQVQESKSRPGKISVKNFQNKLDWVKLNKPDAIIISQFLHPSDELVHLTSALQELNNVSKNTLLIYNRPIFKSGGFTTQRSLFSQFIEPNPDYPNRVPLSEMDYSSRQIDFGVSAFAKSIGIQLLDTWPVFCDSNFCTRESQKNLLYFDLNHFTLAGAKLIQPYLKNFLSKVS